MADNPNPWRRTADELPAEGQVVEVVSDRFKILAEDARYSGQRAVILFGGFRAWHSLNVFDELPVLWRPITQGESNG